MPPVLIKKVVLILFPVISVILGAFPMIEAQPDVRQALRQLEPVPLPVPAIEVAVPVEVTIPASGVTDIREKMQQPTTSPMALFDKGHQTMADTVSKETTGVPCGTLCTSCGACFDFSVADGPKGIEDAVLQKVFGGKDLSQFPTDYKRIIRDDDGIPYLVVGRRVGDRIQVSKVGGPQPQPTPLESLRKELDAESQMPARPVEASVQISETPAVETSVQTESAKTVEFQSPSYTKIPIADGVAMTVPSNYIEEKRVEKDAVLMPEFIETSASQEQTDMVKEETPQVLKNDSETPQENEVQDSEPEQYVTNSSPYASTETVLPISSHKDTESVSKENLVSDSPKISDHTLPPVFSDMSSTLSVPAGDLFLPSSRGKKLGLIPQENGTEKNEHAPLTLKVAQIITSHLLESKSKDTKFEKTSEKKTLMNKEHSVILDNLETALQKIISRTSSDEPVQSQTHPEKHQDAPPLFVNESVFLLLKEVSQSVEIVSVKTPDGETPTPEMQTDSILIECGKETLILKIETVKVVLDAFHLIHTTIGTAHKEPDFPDFAIVEVSGQKSPDIHETVQTIEQLVNVAVSTLAGKEFSKEKKANISISTELFVQVRQMYAEYLSGKAPNTDRAEQTGTVVLHMNESEEKLEISQEIFIILIEKIQELKKYSQIYLLMLLVREQKEKIQKENNDNPVGAPQENAASYIGKRGRQNKKQKIPTLFFLALIFLLTNTVN